jgi:hypothetical protein
VSHTIGAGRQPTQLLLLLLLLPLMSEVAAIPPPPPPSLELPPPPISSAAATIVPRVSLAAAGTSTAIGTADEDEHDDESGVVAGERTAVPPEVFEHILAALADGTTLQAAAGVCRKWRSLCLAKDFWVYLTKRRFFVTSVANPRLYRGGPDSFGWMDLYKNWESALKLPASAWTRDRVFPVFAQTLTAKLLRKQERKQKELARALRQKERVAGAAAGTRRIKTVPLGQPAAALVPAAPPATDVGALVWVTVRHYEDCKLRPWRPGASGGESTGGGCLELRVLVQNTRDVPLWIRPAAMELDCRPPSGHSPGVQAEREQGWEDGWCTRSVSGDAHTPRFISMLPLPLPGNSDSLEGGLAVSAARKLAHHTAHPSVSVRHTLGEDADGDWTGRMEEAPAVAGSICLSQRWSFAVFSSLRFPVGIAALDRPKVEPEALERCARLRVPLFTSAEAAANAAASVGGNACAGAAAGFATAGFDDERIWAHYTNISGAIWFFEPVVSSTVGL